MGDFFENAKNVRRGNRELNGGIREAAKTAKYLEKLGGNWAGLFGSRAGIPGGYDRGEGRMYKDSSYRDSAEYRSLRAGDRLESYRGHSERNARRYAQEAAAEEEALFGTMYADDIAHENPSLARAAASKLREDPRIQEFLEENGRDANRDGSWSERNFGMGTRGATDAEVLMAYERLREIEVGQPFSKRYLTEELSEIAQHAQVSQSVSPPAPVVTYAQQAAPSAPATPPPSAAASSWSSVTLPPGISGGQSVVAPSAPPPATNTDHWRQFDTQSRHDS